MFENPKILIVETLVSAVAIGLATAWFVGGFDGIFSGSTAEHQAA